jgi:hypothetical protein
MTEQMEEISTYLVKTTRKARIITHQNGEPEYFLIKKSEAIPVPESTYLYWLSHMEEKKCDLFAVTDIHATNCKNTWLK